MNTFVEKSTCSIDLPEYSQAQYTEPRAGFILYTNVRGPRSRDTIDQIQKKYNLNIFVFKNADFFLAFKIFNSQKQLLLGLWSSWGSCEAYFSVQNQFQNIKFEAILTTWKNLTRCFTSHAHYYISDILELHMSQMPSRSWKLGVVYCTSIHTCIFSSVQEFEAWTTPSVCLSTKHYCDLIGPS